MYIVEYCVRTCLEDGNVRNCVLQASFHIDPNYTLRPDAPVAQRSRQRICGVIQLPGRSSDDHLH